MHTARTSRTLVVAVAAALVTLVPACGDGNDDDGSSDGGGGDSWCEQAAALSALDGGGDALTDEQVERLEQFAADAPEEVRDDLELIVEVAQQINDADGDDLESFGEIMDLVFDPEFLEAADAVEAHLTEECGIAPDDEDASGGEDGLDVEDGSGDLGDAFPTFDSMESYFADEGYEWADDIGISGIGGSSGGGTSYEADLQGGNTIADALEACQAAVDHISSFGTDHEVTIAVDGEDVVGTGDGGECAEL